MASSSRRSGFATQPKTAIAIISGTDEDELQTWLEHSEAVSNKSPLKILVERERGHIQELPNFLAPPIIPGTGKATNVKFCTHIHSISRKKSP